MPVRPKRLHTQNLAQDHCQPAPPQPKLTASRMSTESSGTDCQLVTSTCGGFHQLAISGHVCISASSFSSVCICVSSFCSCCPLGLETDLSLAEVHSPSQWDESTKHSLFRIKNATAFKWSPHLRCTCIGTHSWTRTKAHTDTDQGPAGHGNPTFNNFTSLALWIP